MEGSCLTVAGGHQTGFMVNLSHPSLGGQAPENPIWIFFLHFAIKIDQECTEEVKGDFEGHNVPWPKLNLELGRRELQVTRKGFHRAVPETWSSQSPQEL